jgi:DNA-binding MarR family transcriptional regulator
VTDYPFVRKMYALGAAIHDPELGLPEIRLMWWFCEHANEEFEAWPSTRRLARVAGVGHRNVSRHIANLVREGYLVQTYPGSRRNESARYRLTFKGAELVRAWKEQGHRDSPGVVAQDDTPVVLRNDTQGVVAQDDTVSSPMTQGVVSQDAKVSSPRTTEPPTEPAQKAGEVGGGGFGTAPSGAALAAEREALFTQFRTAYPKAVNVADARPVFNKLLDEGVPAARLIEQARALAAYCAAGCMKVEHVKQPAVWLRSRAWAEDEYVVPEVRGEGVQQRVQKRQTAGDTSESNSLDAAIPRTKAAAGEAIDEFDPSDIEYRRFAPGFFAEVRARLEAVQPDQALATKFRDALLFAIKTQPELKFEDFGITSDHVRRETPRAVEQALAGDWGNAGGFDRNGKWIESVMWFGHEACAPAIRASVDAHVARLQEADKAAAAQEKQDAEERERAPHTFNSIKSALKTVDANIPLDERFRRVALQWHRDDPDGLEEATGLFEVGRISETALQAWREAERGEFGSECHSTEAQWWFGPKEAAPAIFSAIEKCFGKPAVEGCNEDIR